MVEIIARFIRSLDRIERVRLQQTSMVADAEVQRINGGNNHRQPQLQYARLSKVEFPQFNGDSEAISGKRNVKNETKIDDKSHVYEVFDEMPKIEKT